MYCPKCAEPNSDDAKYCRACGTYLSLVPQAIAGRLPEADSNELKDWLKSPPSIANGITKIFVGLAFLIIALAWITTEEPGWGYLTLIPAFALLGQGVAHIVSVKYEQRQTNAAAISESAPGKELPPKSFSETLPPPSVAEHTTRELETASEHSQKKA
ncbi:MAG: zinc-ribbon domain-containing protein [Blastocatellia bacterium]|nr:zinc-ribbon domain-containing protein [Blastocatellia bacterium]